MGKKTILIMFMGAAGLAAMLYFLYQKGKGGAVIKQDGAGGSGGVKTRDSISTAEDEDDFRKLVQIFNGYSGKPQDLPWVLDIMDEFLSGKRHLGEAGKINGQVTKAAAFNAAVGQAWMASNPGSVINKLFWDEFQKMRTKRYGL